MDMEKIWSNQPKFYWISQMSILFRIQEPSTFFSPTKF